MSKRDKLIAKIVARPSDADFSDVRALLEAFGYTLARTKGSHQSFTKQGSKTIVISVVGGTKVKRYLLDQICKHLGLVDQE